jgi:hypothetical protein
MWRDRFSSWIKGHILKSSLENRQNILKHFEEEYGIRQIVREEPEWLK